LFFIFLILIKKSAKANPIKIKKFNHTGNIDIPFIANFKISVPYVNGNIYESGLMNTGKSLTGKKRPQRKIIGNLKKFEKVCASKTSLTETAINNPKKVEVIEMNRTLPKIRNQFISERSAKKEAKIMGTKELMIPKIMAPDVFANIRRFKLTGARSNLSNAFSFLSNVMVTANIEVVPNNMDSDMTPGRISLISTGTEDLIKNISVHAIGNIIPQLIFGGLR
jgi:hypothetical protein